MNNFVIDTPDNFWQIRWLDKYMEGHKGFIAGGCFKNILSGERVKDIDIFFESESDFQEAIDLFNDEKHQKEGWKFKYRNEKVCAFQKEGEKVWIEFIESEFGKPEEILRSFDFTVAKTMLPITSVSGRGPHGELILEACDKAAELAVIYADALIKELK